MGLYILEREIYIVLYMLWEASLVESALSASRGRNTNIPPKHLFDVIRRLIFYIYIYNIYILYVYIMTYQ